jgi:hypothetical protein
MLQDRYGLTLSTSSEAAATVYRDGDFSPTSADTNVGCDPRGSRRTS